MYEPGMLTPRGMSQLHEAGEGLHKRYVQDLQFSPGNYSGRDHCAPQTTTARSRAPERLLHPVRNLPAL